LADLVKDNDVIIGEVDATQETQTAEAYDVKGYPTLKFFLDGVVIEYNGARTADDMYGWIKRIGETVLE
jgi:protein disulfide-isomerase A1